jgi:hypothetical protein
MKKLCYILALLLAFTAPALAQVNPGTSPLSIAKGGTAANTRAGAAANILPAFTGDVTSSLGGSVLTLAGVNSNVGSFGSATQCVSFTTNAKGLITAASAVPCTPAVASITGLGAGVATSLGLGMNTSGGMVGPVPTRAGDVIYWNGTTWVTLAGNNSGIQVLEETSAGVPSWATVSGTGTVTAITAGSGVSFSSGSTCTTACTVFVNGAGGYVNKFRNGGMVVWQRGTSSLATAASLAKPCLSTADGWCVVQTGAQATCAQDVGNGGPLFSLKCVGITSNTDTTFSQRIESYVAAPMAGQIVTVQFQYRQSSGGSVTPKVSTGYASASDNFTTVTADLAATNLTACATNTWCTESYTFTVSANATQGYQVTFDCNTPLTAAQACWIDAADIRATPGLATGINALPPAPELRAVAAETVFCQRYYFRRNASSATDVIGMMQVWGATQFFGVLAVLPTQMRVTPASLVSSLSHLEVWNATAAAATNVSALNFTGNSVNQLATQSGAAAGATLVAGNAAMMQFNTASGWIDASSEL